MANWLDEYKTPSDTPKASKSNWLSEYPDFGDVESGASSRPLLSSVAAKKSEDDARTKAAIDSGEIPAPVSEQSFAGTESKPTTAKTDLLRALSDIPDSPVAKALIDNPAVNITKGKMAQWAADAGMLTMAPAALVDTIRGDNAATDYVGRNFIDPNAQMARDNQVAPDASLADKVVLGGIAMAPDLVAAGMTAGGSLEANAALRGGEAALARAAGQSERSLSVEQAIEHAARAAQIPATAAGIQTAKDVIDNGGTMKQAVESMIVTGGATALQFAVPMNVAGGTLSRVVQGAAQGPLANYAQGTLENAVLPEDMKRDLLNPVDNAVAAITGGAMGGTLGERSAPVSRIEAIANLGREVAGDRIHTPETAAVDMGREAAAAMYEKPAADPRKIDLSNLPPLNPELATSPVRPTGDAARIAELAAKPEPTLFEREELDLLRNKESLNKSPDLMKQDAAKPEVPVSTAVDTAPEPMNNGAQVLYRGDVDALRAKLQDAGLPQGMKVMENGEAVGVKLPVALREQADALIAAKPVTETVAPVARVANPEPAADVPPPTEYAAPEVYQGKDIPYADLGIKPPKPRNQVKSAADFDPAHHDVRDYIALNGGLDATAFGKEFGVDPAVMKDQDNTRFFGKPLFRKKGGMKPDQLRERLQGEGFLAPEDPNAPPESTPQDAFDLVERAMGGDSVFHPDGVDAQNEIRAWKADQSDAMQRQDYIDANHSIPESDAAFAKRAEAMDKGQYERALMSRRKADDNTGDIFSANPAKQLGDSPDNPRPYADMQSAPVGSWVTGYSGPGVPKADVFQVRDVKLSDILAPELAKGDEIAPEKSKYVDTYAERMKAGDTFPNAHGYELADGRVKLADGHRRMMAAKKAGKDSIRIAVSPIEQPSSRKAAQSGDMFGAATTKDYVSAAEREADAKRNGLRGGRELNESGGLFDGKRPAQTVLRSQRQAVLDPDIRATAAFEAKIKDATESLGLTPEQADGLRTKLAAPLKRDALTGFHRAEERADLVAAAQKHVKDTGERADYVEADLRNLGGLNETLGHTAADKVFRKITDIFHEEMDGAGAEFVAVRHGGDEFSGVVRGGDDASVAKALDRANARVDDYVKSAGLDSVVNPKGGPNGSGIYTHHEAISPDQPVSELFGNADKVIEGRKKERRSGNRTNESDGVGQANPRADTGRAGEDRRTDAGTQRSGEGEGSSRVPAQPSKEPAQVKGALFSKRDPQTETPEFKRWFGDSKVVDARGEPLVVYHGTAKDFDAFNNAKTGANDLGLWGRGHYFSSTPTGANSYALRQGEGARVVPAYVSIRKPLILRTGNDLVTRMPDGTNTRELTSLNLDGSKIKEIALKDGHDGVVQIKPDGSIGDVVAYSPEQIKSATGNNGQFDPANPSILKSASKSDSASTPLTRDEINADVKRVFGSDKVLTRLINSGVVELTTKAEAVKRGLGTAEELRGVKGLHDGDHGYLITDELRPNEVAGVLMHEIGVHHAMERILGKPLFDALQKSMESFKARGDADVKAAYDAVPNDTDTQHVNHEAIAYLTEHSANHKITQRVEDGVKLFLNRLGIPLSYLKAEPAAIRKIARESLLAESRGDGKPIRLVDGKTVYGANEDDGEVTAKYSKRAEQTETPDENVSLKSRRTPSEDAEKLPKFNSATEFWTNNIGKPLFDAISRGTKAVIANDFMKRHGMNLAEDMPPEAQKAWRAYKQDVGNLKKTVSEIADEAKLLTPAERAMVSDYVEREMKAGVTPPESVVRMGALMTSIMRKQSQQLVESGMLSKDAADRWEGRYLPRFYEKHLLTNPFDSMLRKAYLSGIKANHMKMRGLPETIAVEDFPAYEKMGWSLLKDNGKQPDLAGMERGSKIRVWRDWTKSEREKMGEVRDAMYRFARGYTDTQIDIAKGKLFDHIARTVARDDNPGGSYVLVPDTSVEGTGVKKFGNLAGKYVPGDVLSALKAKSGPDSMLMKAYLKALSWWKEGKTSLNPTSHVNNIVSNVVMADLAGVNLLDPRSWKLYADTFMDYGKGGKSFREAQKAGLFGGEWYGNEVGQYLPTPIEIKNGTNSGNIMGQFAQKTVSMIGKGISTGRELMGDAYQAEDQFFKLLLYKQGRDRGLEPDDAVTWAERFVFDYSTAAPGVTKLKNYVFPFANYSSKAVPALAFAATHYPWRIAKWIGLLSAYSMYSFNKLYGDDDDDKMREAESAFVPDYIRGRSAFFGIPKAIRLPYNDESTGNGMYMDISRFLPMGDMFDMNNQMGGVPLPAPLIPNNPVLTTAIAMLSNKDSFTGNDLVLKSDTDGEATMKRLGWLYRQMAPNNPLVPGSYSFNKLAEAAAATAGKPIGPYTGLNYNGDTISPGMALAQVFGIKLRSVDFDKERDWQVRDLEREIADLKGQKTQKKRNKSISEATLESELNNLDVKIDRVKDKLNALSNIPSPSRR